MFLFLQVDMGCFRNALFTEQGQSCVHKASHRVYSAEANFFSQAAFGILLS